MQTFLNVFNYSSYKGAIVRFFYEAFFEFAICIAVGFKLREIKEIWTYREYIVFTF